MSAARSIDEGPARTEIGVSPTEPPLIASQITSDANAGDAVTGTDPRTAGSGIAPRIAPHFTLRLGALATVQPAITPAAGLEAGLFFNRWSLSVLGHAALPGTAPVTINPERSGTVSSFSFAAAVAGGRCFGDTFIFCPALAVGLRGLSVTATGTLYRPGTALSAVPTVGLDLTLHYRLFTSLWLTLAFTPSVPLGRIAAAVEGTALTVSSATVEGWFGVGVRWSPGFHFD